MRAWTPARVADAAGARLLGDRGGAREGPTRAAIDSRTLEGGELFVGLGGTRTDGGTHARDALAVEGAAPGDVVVIAGKGHEQGQEFEQGRKEPFDDVTVARDALRATLGVPR